MVWPWQFIEAIVIVNKLNIKLKIAFIFDILGYVLSVFYCVVSILLLCGSGLSLISVSRVRDVFGVCLMWILLCRAKDLSDRKPFI